MCSVSPSPVSVATGTNKLARPKANRLGYPDRRSVYWLDELPPERTGTTTEIQLTSRWSELCCSKKLHTTQVTFSPIWEVSDLALRAVPSKRLCSLAQPRPPAAGWQPDRPLLTARLQLNRATQSAAATPRLCRLAQPKRRRHLENSGHGSQPAPTMPHLTYKSSAHIELLSTPKHENPRFQGERAVCWPVSRAARSYVASRRLLELSTPKERRPLFEGYDPYVVSRAARSTGTSPRIQQLSLPLPRKCSSRWNE